jgi:hypothetical protein
VITFPWWPTFTSLFVLRRDTTPQVVCTIYLRGRWIMHVGVCLYAQQQSTGVVLASSRAAEHRCSARTMPDPEALCRWRWARDVPSAGTLKNTKFDLFPRGPSKEGLGWYWYLHPNRHDKAQSAGKTAVT